MIKKTITYTDYNGTKRTEDFFFNFSRAEVIEMNYDADGGLEEMYKRVVNANSEAELIKLFKKLVLDAYGIKCDEGRRFKKTEEDRLAFSQTEAYVELFMELAKDEAAASEFFNGVIPKPEEVAPAAAN